MSNTHTILVIEDALELRGALTDQLSLYEEYEAAAAENGNQGIQVAKTERIDLVIMDVGLPDIDGREAARFDANYLNLAGHFAGVIEHHTPQRRSNLLLSSLILTSQIRPCTRDGG